MDGFPSGQRGQTVNLLQIASVVRIHLHPPGATGFDMVSRIRGAGRGLLATLNRGTVKLIGKNNTQGQLALAA